MRLNNNIKYKTIYNKQIFIHYKTINKFSFLCKTKSSYKIK